MQSMFSIHAMLPEAATPLETKVRFLKRTDAYPNRTSCVETVETHFAHVFLTDRFAYKLKKPMRFHSIDFRTVELRGASCTAELRLNRRLADNVYVDVVPLSLDGDELVLESWGRGAVVDWLVKMHRLERDRMLDARAVEDEVTDEELRRLMTKLAAFYARAHRASWSGAGYRRHLEQELRRADGDLAAHADRLDGASVNRVVHSQLEFMSREAGLVEARCRKGRVVDAHGDLRPEHVFLGDPPQIIDCLEFSAELRLLDAAEEIAFLALECTELGAPELAARIVKLYRELCRDPVPEPLLNFYYSHRALARARSCAWHLDEPLTEQRRAHWLTRMERYLEAARLAIEHA